MKSKYSYVKSFAPNPTALAADLKNKKKFVRLKFQKEKCVLKILQGLTKLLLTTDDSACKTLYLMRIL